MRIRDQGRPQPGAVHAALPGADGAAYSRDRLGDSAAVSRVHGPRALDRSSVLPLRRRGRAAPFQCLEGQGSLDRQARHRNTTALCNTRFAARAAPSALQPCGAAAVRAAALRLAATLQSLSGDSIAILLAAGLVLGIFPVYGCPTFLF